jgi:hypothetical protein
MHKEPAQRKVETRSKQRDKKRTTKMKMSGKGMKRFGGVKRAK